MEVRLTLPHDAVIRLCEVDWRSLVSHDWFLCVYKSGKFSRVGGSSPMIQMLADSIGEKINRTEAIRLIYRETLAMHCKGGMVIVPEEGE